MKVCLNPEYVDGLTAPAKGEFWIGDTHVRHFGVRGWAGKKGGIIAFAIRLRNSAGRLVRETFDVWRDYLDQHGMWSLGNYWEKPLGDLLEPARQWARDRIAFHYGYPTRQQIVDERRKRKREEILATTLRLAINRRLDELRKKSNNHEYVDHIQNLTGAHISSELFHSTFAEISSQGLADAITGNNITYGNVSVLRSFIGGVFKRAQESCGPLGLKLDSIQERCRKNLRAREEPRYPEILNISDADYRHFFNLLEGDGHWREALAIRLYFATGAKMQQVIKARWSDIVDNRWYPYLPKERKLWSSGSEPLDHETMAVISLIERCHGGENIASPFLFPSLVKPDQHLKTVQRHWVRLSGAIGWQNLPISHVVLRHRPRSNPSYYMEFLKYYRSNKIDFERRQAVSKIVNRRKNIKINAITYR